MLMRLTKLHVETFAIIICLICMFHSKFYANSTDNITHTYTIMVFQVRKSLILTEMSLPIVKRIAAAAVVLGFDFGAGLV